MRKTVLAALAATMVCGSAQAATVYDFTLTGAQTALFTLPSTGSVNAGSGPVYSNIFGTYNGISTLGNVQLSDFSNDASGGLNVTSNAGPYLVNTNGPMLYSQLNGIIEPVPGNYILQGVNFPVGLGAGTANLTIASRFVPDPVTSAVPEAATWAMMMVGLGVVGGSLRRRRSVSTRVSFA